MRAVGLLVPLALSLLPGAAVAQATQRPCGEGGNLATRFMAGIEIAILEGDLASVREANTAVADTILFSAPDPFPPDGFDSCRATGEALSRTHFVRLVRYFSKGSTCRAATQYVVAQAGDRALITNFSYVVTDQPGTIDFDFPQIRSWSETCTGETTSQ